MIAHPTLLLSPEICRANIHRMAEKARNLGIPLRPHVKTPQAAGVGLWLREAGIDRITVSSARMAAYFADNGWQDITIAFPVNIREMDLLNNLAGRVQLNLLVVAPETLPALAAGLQHPVGIFIEIDTGSKRSGYDAADFAGIDRMLETLNSCKNLNFKGFLTHAGHTYAARSADAVREIHADSLQKLQSLRACYADAYPNLIVSLGDTPSCSVATDFTGINELRPGNFIFYDWMQVQIGACHVEDIAVCMACPVIAVYPERGEAIVYGGAVHLSKDYLLRPDGTPYFGLPVQITADEKWALLPGDNYVRSISQEHGVVRLTPEVLSTLKPGDLLGILPIHSCLTADMVKQYRLPGGEILEMMRL